MSIRQLFSSRRAKLVASALAATIGAGASPALAVPISAGTNISATFEQPVAGQPNLSATLDLTVQSISSTQIVLGVSIDNTTSPAFASGQLTAFGWDSSIIPSGAIATSSVFAAYLSQSLPANPSTNLCLSGGSSCASGGGLSPGQGDLFTMTLDGSFGGATPDFSDFVATFDTAYGTFAPQDAVCVNCGGGSVPEPSTFTIFGAALLAALGWRFARRSAPQLLPVRA